MPVGRQGTSDRHARGLGATLRLSARRPTPPDNLAAPRARPAVRAEGGRAGIADALANSMRAAIACLPGLALGLFGTIAMEAWLTSVTRVPSPAPAWERSEPRAATLDAEQLAARLQLPLRALPPPEGPPPRWSVAGVLESRRPEDSRALLRDVASRTCTAALGEVLEGYTVVEIADRRVVLEREGRRVVLGPGAPDSSQGSSATPFSRLRALLQERAPGVFQANRGALQAALGEAMGELLISAHLVPAFEGGRATGLKLLNLREGSPLGWLGLQRADVLTSVGGVALTSPEAMLAALPAVQRAPVIEVAWLRGGHPMQARLELQ